MQKIVFPLPMEKKNRKKYGKSKNEKKGKLDDSSESGFSERPKAAGHSRPIGIENSQLYNTHCLMCVCVRVCLRVAKCVILRF